MTALLVVILVVVCLLGVGLVYILLRLVRLEATPQTLQDLRIESRSQNDNLAGLQETTLNIRSEVARAQNDLAAVQAHLQARQELDRRNADALHWLEMVIAGTQSKGAAGEHILDEIFSKLPVEWQERDYHVNGDVHVEFGLRLPNGLVLPIDSKIPATTEFASFMATDDIDKKKKIKVEIERQVFKQVIVVQKYLDPNLTIGLGLVVVPDGVYQLCGAILAEASKQNTLIISYSLFLPYILLTYKIALAACSDIDRYRLDGYLRSTQQVLDRLQIKLEGSYTASLKQLSNSRDAMASLVSQLSAGLANLRQFALGAEIDLPNEANEEELDETKSDSINTEES